MFLIINISDFEKEQKLVSENKFLRMKLSLHLFIIYIYFVFIYYILYYILMVLQMEEATKDIKRLMYEKEKLIDISNMLRSDIVQLNDQLSHERGK